MNETFLGGHFHLAEGGHFQKFTGVIFIWSDGVNLHGFFHISNQRMNEYLKELGEICGFNEPVTVTYYKGNRRIDEVFPKWQMLGTHTGRRTFICNALMLGIAPQIVMKWTGHSDYKAMKPYIDIADAAKADAMKLFDK